MIDVCEKEQARATQCIFGDQVFKTRILIFYSYRLGAEYKNVEMTADMLLHKITRGLIRQKIRLCARKELDEKVMSSKRTWSLTLLPMRFISADQWADCGPTVQSDLLWGMKMIWYVFVLRWLKKHVCDSKLRLIWPPSACLLRYVRVVILNILRMKRSGEDVLLRRHVQGVDRRWMPRRLLGGMVHVIDSGCGLRLSLSWGNWKMVYKPIRFVEVAVVVTLVHTLLYSWHLRLCF